MPRSDAAATATDATATLEFSHQDPQVLEKLIFSNDERVLIAIAIHHPKIIADYVHEHGPLIGPLELKSLALLDCADAIELIIGDRALLRQLADPSILTGTYSNRIEALLLALPFLPVKTTTQFLKNLPEAKPDRFFRSTPAKLWEKFCDSLTGLEEAETTREAIERSTGRLATRRTEASYTINNHLRSLALAIVCAMHQDTRRLVVDDLITQQNWLILLELISNRDIHTLFWDLLHKKPENKDKSAPAILRDLLADHPYALEFNFLFQNSPCPTDSAATSSLPALSEEDSHKIAQFIISYDLHQWAQHLSSLATPKDIIKSIQDYGSVACLTALDESSWFSTSSRIDPTHLVLQLLKQLHAPKFKGILNIHGDNTKLDMNALAATRDKNVYLQICSIFLKNGRLFGHEMTDYFADYITAYAATAGVKLFDPLDSMITDPAIIEAWLRSDPFFESAHLAMRMCLHLLCHSSLVEDDELQKAIFFYMQKYPQLQKLIGGITLDGGDFIGRLTNNLILHLIHPEPSSAIRTAIAKIEHSKLSPELVKALRVLLLNQKAEPCIATLETGLRQSYQSGLDAGSLLISDDIESAAPTSSKKGKKGKTKKPLSADATAHPLERMCKELQAKVTSLETGLSEQERQYRILTKRHHHLAAKLRAEEEMTAKLHTEYEATTQTLEEALKVIDQRSEEATSLKAHTESLAHQTRTVLIQHEKDIEMIQTLQEEKTKLAIEADDSAAAQKTARERSDFIIHKLKEQILALQYLLQSAHSELAKYHGQNSLMTELNRSLIEALRRQPVAVVDRPVAVAVPVPVPVAVPVTPQLYMGSDQHGSFIIAPGGVMPNPSAESPAEEAEPWS